METEEELKSGTLIEEEKEEAVVKRSHFGKEKRVSVAISVIEEESEEVTPSRGGSPAIRSNQSSPLKGILGRVLFSESKRKIDMSITQDPRHAEE